MTDDAPAPRLYSDLAPWWPLISPPEEYTDEAAFVRNLLDSATGPVRNILELGSGGGHNAVHLTERFSMTLVDLSPEMLAASRQLNPTCEHIAGDMRTLRLDRAFDAVFVHDAIDYMITESDLRRTVETAYAHCRPEGVAVFVPDHTTETFEPTSGCGGTDAEDGRGARYLEWTWDPNPNDTWVRTEYAFLLRDADGSVQVVNEHHRTGLFNRETWLRLLSDAGFEATIVTEQTPDERRPRDLFVARRAE
jgi:SAM-dependent methyltransferase